jgi:hypothetical protein
MWYDRDYLKEMEEKAKMLRRDASQRQEFLDKTDTKLYPNTRARIQKIVDDLNKQAAYWEEQVAKAKAKKESAK